MNLHKHHFHYIFATLLCTAAAGFLFVGWQSRPQEAVRTDFIWMWDGSYAVTTPLKNTFTFTSFFAEWTHASTTEPLLSFRTSNNSATWSAWYPLREQADLPTDTAGKLAAGWRVSDVQYGKARWLQVRAEMLQYDMPIADLQTTFYKIPSHIFDSTVFAGQATGFAAEAGIVPRERWLPTTDELTSRDAQELWPIDYRTADKIIIHHTAGQLKDVTGDDVLTKEDYEIMVRNLYIYHAKKLGWGDVGYNYIIDPLGTIYEGHRGGEGVEGGHTLRSALCNKDRFKNGDEAIGFNQGTIGIALLGDYESENITVFARASLVKLVGYEAAIFGIDPAGSSAYRDAVYPNVGGHHDFDCTNCPGAQVVNILPQIRAEAKNQASALLGRMTRKATLVGQKNMTITLEPGEVKTVTLQYRNDGNTNWHSFPGEGIYVGNSLAQANLSRIGGFNLATATGRDGGGTASFIQQYVTTYATTPIVPPGSVGVFAFTVTAPTRAQSEHTYVLASGNEGWFPETEVTITLINGDAAYLAEVQNHTISETLFAENGVQATLALRNTGTETWKKDSLFLEVTAGPDTPTPLNVGWETPYGWFTPAEETIAPGNAATFVVPLRADAPGIYPLHIVLRRYTTVQTSYPKLIWPKKDITGGVLDTNITVRSNRQAEIVEHTMPIATRVGWRPDAKLVLQNAGSVPWTSRSIKLIAANDAAKELYDPADWLDKETPALMHERMVAPGSKGTFTFRLRTRDADSGVYTLQFKVLLDGKTVYFGDAPVMTFKLRVDDTDGTLGTNVIGDASASLTPSASPAPTAKTLAPATTAPVSAANSATYIVKVGDTLSGIAAKYLEKGQTYLDIIAANKAKYPRITNGSLQIGWVLVLPSVEPQYATYAVQPGDSLISIDAKHMTRKHTYKDIIAYNKDTYPSIVREVLQPGWKLKVDF